MLCRVLYSRDMQEASRTSRTGHLIKNTVILEDGLGPLMRCQYLLMLQLLLRDEDPDSCACAPKPWKLCDV